MSEQELKLHIPGASRAAIEKDLLRGAVTRIKLRAQYFDTPTRELVKAQVALRLRQEGRQWVQTLKMPGEHVLSRVEINHNRPGPVLDLSLYVGTVAEPAIAALKGALEVCYETDVNRVLRRIRTARGVVEVALDTGCLRTGALELPISEVEFELISGDFRAVLELGRRWQLRHNLVLDARSKAERGDRLAQLSQQLASINTQDTKDNGLFHNPGQALATAVAGFWAPRNAQSISLAAGTTPAQALEAVTLECLDQIIRNAAILAEVDTAGVCLAGTAEHTHQLRVGIRRLRSAWSFFKDLTPLPPLELREAIKAHFAKLGGTRDDDVLNATILPILRAAGQPPLVLDSADATTHESPPVAGSVAFQSWILETLTEVLSPAPSVTILSMTVPDAAPVQAQTLKRTLTAKLRKWHRQVLRDGLSFEQLDIESRHALRKRAKKLRYALQFTESLFTAKKLKAYRKQLSVVQDILGEMNDLAVARERFVGLRDTQPSAWFACGWITSRLDALAHQATRAFNQLANTEKFWT
jgi:inorganic triphosphatase YgiF